MKKKFDSLSEEDTLRFDSPAGSKGQPSGGQKKDLDDEDIDPAIPPLDGDDPLEDEVLGFHDDPLFGGDEDDPLFGGGLAFTEEE